MKRAQDTTASQADGETQSSSGQRILFTGNVTFSIYKRFWNYLSMTLYLIISKFTNVNQVIFFGAI